MTRIRFTLRLAVLFVALVLSHVANARADQVSVAVGANFLGTLEQLAPLFQKATGHTLQISAGSSGQLVAQIKAGAPYDVLLSADAERPAQLVKEGLALASSRFVYATGALVLWSRDPQLVDAQGQLLKSPKLDKVSLADPRSAPYGAAAQRVMERLGVWKVLQEARKIVLGTSVAQAYQFAATGSVPCAFVALSQVIAGKVKGSSWKVPEQLYPPLAQEAVLLSRAKNKPAANALLRWLKQDGTARATIRAAGYAVR